MEINTPWLKNKATGIVSVKAPVGDTRTVSGNPVSIDNPSGLTSLTGLSVDIEPVQDLNGYDAPWVGGAGKNKLQVTATSQTILGITFTVNDDGTITANGTSPTNVNTIFRVGEVSEGGSYIINGSPSGADNTYGLRIGHGTGNAFVGRQHGADYPYTSSDKVIIEIYVFGGQTLNNVVFKPMIRLASEADATFEPYENICPITGHTSATVTRTGKNLLGNGITFPHTQNGITLTKNDDGQIVINGRVTAGFIVSNVFRAVNLSSEKRYTLSKTVVSGTVTDGRVNITGTTPAHDSYYSGATGTDAISGTKRKTVSLNLYFSVVGAVFENYTLAYQVEEGNATAYEPYTGQAVTIDLNGTVYGGELDVLAGVLTVTHGIVDLGTYNWRKATASGNDRFFTTNMQTMVEKPATNKTVANIVCSAFVKAAADDGYIGRVRNSITIDISGTVSCYPTNGQYADGESFKTAMNGIQFVYPLATPTTVQLTAQQASLLTGTNIISTDMNSLTVTTLNPDWQSLIDPSSMKVSRYDLDAGETTGRNLEGYMLRDRQAVKEKIEMEFPPMYASDFHTMMELTKEQSFYVWYYSPYYGQWRAADMYVGDREGNLYYGYDSGHAPEQMWTDIKFNFIER